MTLTLGLASQFSQAESKKHFGCYYGTWAYARIGMGKFWPEDIDVSLCDVIYYGFGNLLNGTFEVCTWDPWFDLDPQLDGGVIDIPNCIGEKDGVQWPPGCITDTGLEYCKHNGIRRTIALKEQNPELKVLYSVGGYSAGGWAFSQMAQTEAGRFQFISSAVHFLNRFGFDGLDLDWEYPGDDGLTGEPTGPDDKIHFTALIKEMREVFDKDGLMITIAGAQEMVKAGNSFELDKLHPYLDWFNIMTYDYGGAWDLFTGVDAPLFGRAEEGVEGHPHKGYNIHNIVQYYLEQGVPAEKISVGIHTQNKGFILDDENQNGLYCPATASPNMTFSMQEGWLDYFEILQFFYNDTIEDPHYKELGIKPGIENWVIQDDGCYLAPYAYQGPLWISYDDEYSAAVKARYVNHYNLKGAFIWEIDTDNHMAGWGRERFTIASAVARALSSGEGLSAEEDLGFAGENVDCKPQAPMCDLTNFTTTSTSAVTATSSASPVTTTLTSVTSAQPSSTSTSTESPSTTVELPSCEEVDCKGNGDLTSYPGDRHKYFKCVYQDGVGCFLEEHSCGDWFFDPTTDSCHNHE